LTRAEAERRKLLDMRTTLAAVVLLAGSRGATPAAAKPQTLADFLPATIGVAKRRPETPPPPAAAPRKTRNVYAAYQLPEGRFVNVNLLWVKDPGTHFKVHRPGEKVDSETTPVRYEGFEVDGFFVQRTQGMPASDPGGTTSEASLLLADRLLVIVSIERPPDPNEPVEWIRKLDLPGLAAFAAPSSPGRRKPAQPK